MGIYLRRCDVATSFLHEPQVDTLCLIGQSQTNGAVCGVARNPTPAIFAYFSHNKPRGTESRSILLRPLEVYKQRRVFAGAALQILLEPF